MKLDLACGQKCKEGFDGVDIAPGPGVTHLVNLFASPFATVHFQLGPAFESESVEDIWCAHFVEHHPDLCAFMDECHRIMKPGGTMTIAAPYYTSIRAWQDPTHVRAITDATFWYFNKAWREREGLSHYPIQSDFDVVTVHHAIHPTWEKHHHDAIKQAMQHYWNVIEDIQVTLRKR